tara:strand:- start:155 stop:472 length:318 start_codon:yes stop_codon:yes gene_type:complete
LSNSRLVYSTSGDLPESKTVDVSVSPSEQRVRLHLDRKGGGKIVTVVKGLQLSSESFKTLEKYLKKKCGVGGTTKDGQILIQGNHRDKIRNILASKGYQVKLSGG